MRSFTSCVVGLTLLTAVQSAIAATESNQFMLKNEHGSGLFSDTSLDQIEKLDLTNNTLLLTIKSTDGDIRRSEYLRIKGEMLPLVNGESLNLGNDVHLEVSAAQEGVTITFSGLNTADPAAIKDVLSTIKYDVKKALPKYRYEHYLDKRIFTLTAE